MRAILGPVIAGWLIMGMATCAMIVLFCPDPTIRKYRPLWFGMCILHILAWPRYLALFLAGFIAGIKGHRK